jgi:hypothetical protein
MHIFPLLYLPGKSMTRQAGTGGVAITGDSNSGACVLQTFGNRRVAQWLILWSLPRLQSFIMPHRDWSESKSRICNETSRAVALPQCLKRQPYCSSITHRITTNHKSWYLLPPEHNYGSTAVGSLCQGPVARIVAISHRRVEA